MLVYPGGAEVYSSMRLELFRDGLEDYEYLRALSVATGQDAREDEVFATLLEKELYDPEASPESLRQHGADLMERRKKIGRALTSLAKRRR